MCNKNRLRDYKKNKFTGNRAGFGEEGIGTGDLPGAKHFRGFCCPKTLINSPRRGNRGVVDPPIKK